MFSVKRSVSLTLALLASACGDDAESGPGMLRVTAYGEEFIEHGIPARDVEDGWAIDFSRFEVALRDVALGGHALANPASVDLSEDTGGQGHALGSIAVPAAAYTKATFTVAGLHIVGSAEKDGLRKSFDWTFEQPVVYAECENSTRVPEAGEQTLQVTIHADHLLHDSLAAEEPALRFQALADADADADGAITRRELERAGIGAYDPGNDDDISSLWAWLEALVVSLGHVDGEGHCHAH
jgi:hypothetical protein